MLKALTEVYDAPAVAAQTPKLAPLDIDVKKKRRVDEEVEEIDSSSESGEDSDAREELLVTPMGVTSNNVGDPPMIAAEERLSNDLVSARTSLSNALTEHTREVDRPDDVALLAAYWHARSHRAANVRKAIEAARKKLADAENALGHVAAYNVVVELRVKEIAARSTIVYRVDKTAGNGEEDGTLAIFLKEADAIAFMRLVDNQAQEVWNYSGSLSVQSAWLDKSKINGDARDMLNGEDFVAAIAATPVFIYKNATGWLYSRKMLEIYVGEHPAASVQTTTK